MKYRIDHDLHLHSRLSSCSGDPTQTPEAILRYAEQNHLSTICLTDHYWDSAVPGASKWYMPQNFDHIAESRPLPQGENTAFLFGCETEFDKHFTLAMPKERFSDFDFIIIPTTHLHMTGLTISEEDAERDERRAALWVERLDRVLDMDLPFHKIGIAHLACSLIKKSGGYVAVLKQIPDAAYERVFTKAAARGCGIELNTDDCVHAEKPEDEGQTLRVFRIAKACGCKFYLGSDAHTGKGLAGAIAPLARMVELLDLDENDKFPLPALR